MKKLAKKEHLILATACCRCFLIYPSVHLSDAQARVRGESRSGYRDDHSVRYPDVHRTTRHHARSDPRAERSDNCHP